MLKGNGIIVYNPDRPGLKGGSDWWCVVNVSHGIADYYRYWVSKNLGYYGLVKTNLQPPSWKAHISIVRGEEPKDEFKHFWKKYDKKRIFFTYTPEVKMTLEEKIKGGQPMMYFYINIDCPFLMEMREELGLPTYNPIQNRKFNSHLTVARALLY